MKSIHFLGLGGLITVLSLFGIQIHPLFLVLSTFGLIMMIYSVILLGREK